MRSSKPSMRSGRDGPKEIWIRGRAPDRGIFAAGSARVRNMKHFFAGIDIGSTMTKVVILDGPAMASSIIGPTGPEHRRLANKVMEDALGRAGLRFDDLAFVVATGYGRINVPFADKQVTEITCHAKGLHSLLPTARTVVDIGGQDSKA